MISSHAVVRWAYLRGGDTEEHDHFGASQRSSIALKRNLGDDIPMDMELNNASAYNCNTFAYVVLLSDFASRPAGQKSDLALPSSNRPTAALSATLLESFIGKFVTEPYSIDAPTHYGTVGLNIDVEAVGVTVSMAEILSTEAGRHLTRHPFAKRQGPVFLHELLISLVADERQRSLSQGRRLVSKGVCRSIFQSLHSLVECSKGDPMWDMLHVARMTQLRSLKGLRTVSPAFKCAVVDQCTTTPNQRHVTSFLSAKHAVEHGDTKVGRGSLKDFIQVERYPERRM